MQELLSHWQNNEEDQIQAELDKLFAFQDRPLTKEKKALFLRELSLSGLPFKSVLSGIRKLLTEELTSIKLSTIMAVSRGFTENETYEKCGRCFSGYKIAIDEQGRNFALACQCPQGIGKSRTQALVIWNGKEIQSSRGRMLRIA